MPSIINLPSPLIIGDTTPLQRWKLFKKGPEDTEKQPLNLSNGRVILTIRDKSRTGKILKSWDTEDLGWDKSFIEKRNEGWILLPSFVPEFQPGNHYYSLWVETEDGTKRTYVEGTIPFVANGRA